MFSEGIRFSCQGSGKCCMSRGAYGYVYFDLEDRRRMARCLGLTTLQFTRRYLDKSEGWFHLKHPERDCLFLEKKRCTVYEGRPRQCRTWPFWPENMQAKTWTKEIAAFCPGIGQGRLYSAEEIQQTVDYQASMRP